MHMWVIKNKRSFLCPELEKDIRHIQFDTFCDFLREINLVLIIYQLIYAEK